MTQMQHGVLVIDAEGWYGDEATVYARAASIDDLPKQWQRPGRQYRVVSDRGWPREAGTKIHRQFAWRYESVENAARK